jgi:hypothetical protein
MTNESIERSEESFDPELTPEEQEEKARLIAQVLELQSTLEVRQCDVNIVSPSQQCWGSVTFSCGSGSADLYLLRIRGDFKDENFFSSYFFLLLTYLFCNTFMRK